MLHITENKLKDMLIEVEGADVKISNTSRSKVQYLHTIADIQTGRFRKLFDRHRNAYKLFN
jgi:hypothetical protein